MSEGTPPPPPPYGGGSQGGQPYGQPYGSPPPQGQPYGSPPPSGDPYNQPPSYGAPSPEPYGQPPGYGAAPQYGSYGNAPAYGQPYGAAPYGAAGAVPGNLASMGKRFAARLIDALISLVIIGVLGALLIGGAASTIQTDPVTGEVTSGGGLLGGALFGYIGLVFVYSIAYELVLIALRGATLGKMAMGIKVVREQDGAVPGWGPSALRWVIPQVAGLVCGLVTLLVYLSPFFDNTGRQQGWHDKVAKTLVVNAK
jgi:uncharacterized RDD family membrane protein YckC